jgi:formyl-CoA transferase
VVEQQAALAGVRVLEVTQFEVGTVAGQQLAWLGADVIKVEQPGRGDLSRVTTEFFATLNSSKRGVTLDLKTEEGRNIFLELVACSDVVIENQGPGEFERLGLSYDDLSDANPGIIFARAKGFGTYGPHAGFKSFDMVAQATSGAMAATGPVGGAPMIERFPIADNATGIHLALGIVAALWQRQTTGRGQQVEASLQDVMFSMGRMRFAHELHGRSLARGNRLGPAGDLYPCAPGGDCDAVFILCHPLRQRMWDALFTTIGREDLRLADEAGDPVARHREHAGEIDESIRAWTMQRTKFEAMELLGSAGVPCGAVLTAEEALDDPHLRARDMVVQVDHPRHGPLTILGSPIKLSDSAPLIRAAPLDMGEHNHEVICKLLGHSPALLAELADKRVV